MDFVGHALALYQDDSFLDRPAAELTPRVKVRKGGGEGKEGGEEEAGLEDDACRLCP